MELQKASPHTCCSDAQYEQTRISRADGIAKVAVVCKHCDANWVDIFGYSHSELKQEKGKYRPVELGSCCGDARYEHDTEVNEGERVEIYSHCTNCGADWKDVFTYGHSKVDVDSLPDSHRAAH